MKDRISGKPGRVLIAPEDGSTPYYAVMTRADEPEQEGTPLNKANLLTDDTAALLGLGADAVPDDALRALRANGAAPSFHPDFYQFVTGAHFAMRLSPVYNYDTVDRGMKARSISITGDAQTITVYDALR